MWRWMGGATPLTAVLEGWQFWSPFFGVVRDRFATPWQIGVEGEPPS